MSATYSISNRERWRLHSDHETRLSEHALNRWDDRTPEDSVSPEHAFDNSVDVSMVAEALEDNAGDIPDTARYWYEKTETEGYGVVFLVYDLKNQTNLCKTVYRVGFIDSGPVRSYLAAHNHEFQHE